MPIVNIDLDTIQPNGKPGDPARTAFTKVNANFEYVEDRLSDIGEVATGAVTQQQLTGALGTKANTSELNTLSGIVATKANTSELNTLSGVVATQGSAILLRATQAALQAEIDARVSSYSSLRSLLGRNAIINGAMRYWQRGLSLPASARIGYLADRWRDVALTSTVAASRMDMGVGDLGVPSRYFKRIVVASGNAAGAAVNHQQAIENVRTFSGKTVVYSTYVRAAANGFISLELVQSFGTGGNPSAEVSGIGAKKIAVTTGWNRVSITATLPSVAGKTLGTNGNDALVAVTWFDAGSSFDSRTQALGNQSGTFDVTCCQLELGDAPTDFEIRPEATELILCQRYGEKSYDVDTQPGTGTVSGRCGGGMSVVQASIHYFNQPFKVTKRTAPAVTIYNPGSGAPGGVADSNGSTVSTNLGGANQNSFELNWSNASGRWGGWFHYFADAEI